MNNFVDHHGKRVNKNGPHLIAIYLVVVTRGAIAPSKWLWALKGRLRGRQNDCVVICDWLRYAIAPQHYFE